MPKFKVEHSLEKASELEAERMAVLSDALKSTSEVMEQKESHASQGQEVACPNRLRVLEDRRH